MRSATVLTGMGLLGSAMAAPTVYDPSYLHFRAAEDSSKLGIMLMNRIAPGTAGLYIADADGSNEQSFLGNNTVFEYHAQWSPDGEWIIFTSERNGDGNSDLYRARPDGSDLQLLAGSSSVEDAGTISPDGTKIAYVSTANGYKSNIWVQDIASGSAWNLTNTAETVGESWSPDGHFRPAFSPDGEWIIFSSDRNTKWVGHGKNSTEWEPGWEHTQALGVYAIRPDGTGFREIIKAGLDEYDNYAFSYGSPKFSPDGSRIVYYNMTREQTWNAHRPEDLSSTTNQIWSTDFATGLDVRQETTEEGVKVFPQYVSNSSIGYLIKGTDAAGIHYTTNSSEIAGDMRSPAWSPDGTKVIYEKFDFTVIRAMDTELYSWDSEWEYRFTDVFPRLNSDGRLAITQKQLGNSSIVTMWPNGTDVQLAFDIYDGSQLEPALVAQGLSGAFQPSWSPTLANSTGDWEDKWIAFGLGAWFQERAVATAWIMRATANGSYYEELTDGSINSGFPTYSLDGKTLVYRVWSEYIWGLRSLDIESGVITNLTCEWDNLPMFSPDGSRILFTRRMNETNYDVLTMNPDGTDVQVLTSSGANDAHAVWSADGRIMYSTGQYGFRDECAIYDQTFQPYGQIQIMNADGSNKTLLTDSIWEDSMPLYVPNKFL